MGELHRYHRRDDDGLWNRRTGDDVDPSLATILSVLGAQPVGIFFDTDYTDGLDLVDDSGTERCTAIDSRPIVGQTQYTVGPQLSLPLAPATALTPNGRRMLSFAGSQYLSGAGALAALFAGTAPYTAVSVARKTSGGTTVARWGFDHSSLDNRVVHTRDSSGFDAYLRTAAGTPTSNGPGLALTLNTSYVLSSTFNGSTYSSWRNGVASISAAANTRAPATLDLLVYGARLSAGAYNSFWFGEQAGLAICSGVLSAGTLSTLEHAVGAYYGYPF